MSGFFARHPIWRDALLWSIPALLVGAALRLLFLHYSPLAYWGSDSGSYFWTAQRLLLEGQLSLPAKRHYLYPIVLVPVTMLPGSTLGWLAWFQHIGGLFTTVAIAYVVRAVFLRWSWWIIPVTLFYATLPILLWYEHEMIAEGLFAHSLAWAFAGWVSWYKSPSRRAWWLFLLPLAICLLTKTAGRFFWPGLIVGLLVTKAWKRLTIPQWIVTGLLLLVSWTMGEKSQGVRLLYTSTFPLTRLDTPQHSEYKSEISDIVRQSRERLDVYYLNDDDPKEFLRRGWKDSAHYTTWAALRKDEPQLWSMVKDLALEGVKHEPHLFLGIGLQRTIGAISPDAFRLDRFSPAYYPERMADQHSDWTENAERGTRQANLLMGRPQASPLPSLEELQSALNPHPDAISATIVMAHTSLFQRVFAYFSGTGGPVHDFRPTLFGWWMIAAGLLTILARYRPTLGVWMIIVLGYAVAVHLLGSSNPRFLVPIWPVMTILIAVPADAIATALANRRNKTKIPSE